MNSATPNSSLYVELASLTASGNGVMNSMPREAQASIWGIGLPGGARSRSRRTKLEVSALLGMDLMIAPAPVSLASL
jgi:hypothetical protein